ncbi:chemotaxis protein CheW [Novosphingobium sp. JCM 18896]|nr:chemotaxis protein CheW [Novosphingobium sp. JCM 18896]MCW1427778.1 chemotaxis protein CheW [Novosphingobium sp. JCM 18896]
MQAVTFALGAECFAIPVTLVREILDYGEAFHIPNAPVWLQGITDVRGQGVPTVDLRARLGLAMAKPTLTTRILVVDVPLSGRTVTLGLVVDKVLDVSTFAADQIEAAPDIGVRWGSDYILGVVRRDEGFIVLMDVAQIFSRDADSTLLSQMSAAA